jgi:heptaprenyl diphosphate synthase
MSSTQLRKIIYLSFLIIGAVLLNSVDIIITVPFPFVRVGFSHIISLVVLYIFGQKEMFFVIFFKVLLVGVVWGKIFTPIFFISFAGNIAAGLFLICAFRFYSIIFLSIGASFFNNFAQSLVVYFSFIPQKRILTVFGIMFLMGIISGFLIGLSAKLMLKKLNKSKKLKLDWSKKI